MRFTDLALIFLAFCTVPGDFLRCVFDSNSWYDQECCGFAWNYYCPLQSDGWSMWCAERHGEILEYTIEKKKGFPYNCTITLECPRGTVHDKIRGRCEVTCEEAVTERLGTQRFCRDKCICPLGKYRSKYGNCVPFNKCLKEEKCEAPKIFDRCPSKCQPTCQNPTPDVETESCKIGCWKNVCVCPKATVLLNDESDKCVELSKCPKNCPTPKVYLQCPSKCQPTCDNPEPNQEECDSGCRENFCICPERMVLLNESSHQCVTPFQCPKKCEAPKVFDECPSKCQPTCQNPNPDLETESCKTGCRKDVCVCPKATVLLNDESDKCVELSKCPKHCEFPEIRVECRSTCPVRCDTLWNLDDQDCDVECGEAVCACANGYIERNATDATCVPASSCPPLATEPVPVPISETFISHCLWENSRDYSFPWIKLFSCRPTQSDSLDKWCVKANGKEIPYTRARRKGFPYSCRKTRECPKGTVREKFSGRCQATCEEAVSEEYETAFNCRNKCICPRKQYKNKDGDCVSIDECPKPICKSPMVYTSCASSCPRTCATLKPNCGRACMKGVHCVCPHDMVLMSKNIHTCLREENCPKCEYGSIVTHCAPRCPDTCSENLTCDGCEEGVYCMCPPGMVRINMSLPVRCVPKDQCPLPKCEPPRVPKGCGTACPPTCDDPEPRCTNQSVPENICSCPEGYVQRSATDKTCVTLKDCQTERLECKAPARPELCNSSCPPSCEDSAGSACLRRCNSDSEYVCGCPGGYVQRSRENDTCILVDECPPVCEFPKIYVECASNCQPTCRLPNNPASCKRGCSTQLCVCPEGMVQLSKEIHICLDPSECPTCQTIGHPTKCTATCPVTCNGIDPNCVRACDSKYVCTCPDGYLQISANDTRCVKPDNCQTIENCTASKVYQRCPSKCQPTCENPGSNFTDCDAGCRDDVCVCREGMVLLKGDSDECVMISQCPKECAAPKLYKECPSKCQPTCENQTLSLDECDLGCRKDACVCPDGMVLLNEDSDKCVTPFQCPKHCEFPKVRRYCRSTCAVTCDTLATFPAQKCKVECGEAFCACADGYIPISESNSTCVPVSSCPPPPTQPEPTPIRCDFPQMRANCRVTCSVRCDTLATLDAQECDVECGEEFCACVDGYLQRSETDPTCVPVASCPLLLDQSDRDMPSCEKPKIYKECASKCQPTCETPAPAFCDDLCDSNLHCVCPPGMVHPRNGNDSCVLLSECPESCKFPSVATDCAPICPHTCDSPAPNCSKGCDSDVKCVCPNGLLQVNSTDSSCVLPTQCPNLPENCPPRKIPTACASGCPATCENQNPRFCTKPCQPEVKCECINGMVQRNLEDVTCLWPHQCVT